MGGVTLRRGPEEAYFEVSHSCLGALGSVHVPKEGVDVGTVDIISAGAISQAALYSLLRLPRLRMCGRVFDDDITGLSNLNRNMLTEGKDVCSAKVQLIPQQCGRGFTIQPVL